MGGGGAVLTTNWKIKGKNVAKRLKIRGGVVRVIDLAVVNRYGGTEGILMGHIVTKGCWGRVGLSDFGFPLGGGGSQLKKRGNEFRLKWKASVFLWKKKHRE